MKSYQFYVHDYLRDTVGLSEAGDLIYRRLLDWYHINERALPLDYVACARIASINPDNGKRMEILENVLNTFFFECARGWVHARAQDNVDRFLVWKGGEQGKRDSRKTEGRAMTVSERAKRYREKKKLQKLEQGSGQTLH